MSDSQDSANEVVAGIVDHSIINMEFISLEDQFNCLSMKFIFVCEDGSELNSLLSELNGLDYKNQQIANNKSVVQFIESLPKVSPASDPNIIVKTCHLVKQLISKQKILLPENVSSKIIMWVLKCCDQKSLDLFFCEAFDALTLLFKTNANAVKQVRQSLHC
jgi:hypothetical protein